MHRHTAPKDPTIPTFGICHPDVETGVSSDASRHPEVILPRQTHTCNVGIIEADSEAPETIAFDDTDALVCFRSGTAIGIRTADCVPILLYAPDLHAVAAIHAGWKGSFGGIVDNAVRTLTGRGADPARMEAAMGPCICGGCYEVSPELAERFADAGFGECLTEGKRTAAGNCANPSLDLPAVNRLRLLRLGVPDGQIAMPPCCTLENDIFPSWRRTPGTGTRLLTWIRLRP